MANKDIRELYANTTVSIIGTSTDTIMTPAGNKAVIDNLRANTSVTIGGTDNSKFVTPKTLKDTDAPSDGNQYVKKDGTWTILPPKMPFPKVSAGVGQIANLNPGPNTAQVLPSGGTWYWVSFSFETIGATPSGSYDDSNAYSSHTFTSGIDAGGTQIKDAVETQTHTGFAIRIE